MTTAITKHQVSQSASQTVSDEKLNALAHSMAYELCVSHIEGECIMYGSIEEPWYHLTEGHSDEDERRSLQVSIDYLDARGLLIRDCMDDNMVRFRDESEATRP
jgi:hypothetical protein